MGTEHIVQEGESLIPIARMYDFRSVRTIFDAPENADLKKLRIHVNAIRTGDILMIPDKITGSVDALTGNQHVFQARRSRGVWHLRWWPDEGFCGDPTFLTGNTDLQRSKVELQPKDEGDYSPLHAFTMGIKDGSLVALEWIIHDVWLKRPFDAPERVLIETTTRDEEIACNVAPLVVRSMADVGAGIFDERRADSGFTTHGFFDVVVEDFTFHAIMILPIVKGWGGYWVDLRDFGVTDAVGGISVEGRRWARSSTLNPQVPSEYYDGTQWLPLPDGFDPDGRTQGSPNSNSVGFTKTEDGFVSDHGVWPEVFFEYDFDDPGLKQRRDLWLEVANEVWSRRFRLRRVDCKSAPRTRCCIYDVVTRIAFERVEENGPDVVVVCPEDYRANAGTFFMGGGRLEVLAHEAGHHLFNPDEYPGGGLNTSVNGDGAVNGVDETTVMGADTRVVKKRHYNAFVTMLQRLVSLRFGRDYEYECVDP